MVFTATADGYKPAAKTVSLTAGKVDTVDFVMEVADATPVQPPPGSTAPPQNTQQNTQQQNRAQQTASAPSDSGILRITPDPLSAEILVEDRSMGFGRMQLTLSVGQHTVKFRSPNCVEAVTVTVQKGDRAPLSHKMSCG